MVSSILQILAFILPICYEVIFGKEERQRRDNTGFDKALADGDPTAVTRLLSERFDSVQSKGAGSAGQQADH